jgi:hypothetical protein
MRKTAVLMMASVAVMFGCDDDPTSVAVVYSASLSGANERPAAITTPGSGTFTGTLGADNVLAYTVTWQNLTSASNNAHIPGPILATSGTQPLGVLIDFNNVPVGRTITHGTSGSAQGTIDFKVALSTAISGDSLKKLFDNGALYVNVHTVNNPGGEILGNITKQ